MGILNAIFSNLTIFVSPPIYKAASIAIITFYDVKLPNYNTMANQKKDVLLALLVKVRIAVDPFVPFVNTIANDNNSKASIIK